MEPYIAIGNDELKLTVKKGDLITNGHLKGRLEYGKDGTTGKESNVLGFVTALDGHSYVASIKDKLLSGWEKCND